MEDVDLGDVAIFVRVVDAGSFTKAAAMLVVPKSSVSRRVARLEHRLGTQLLQRTTRSLSMTEAGRAFYTRASAGLAEVSAAASAAIDAKEIPRGMVRVTAPADVGTEVLPRMVVAFLRAYPQVRVEVELSADSPDVVVRGYDLALRVGRQTDPTLTISKLQDMAFRLYAAPAYLDRAGLPAVGADLVDHDCVLFRPQNGSCRWRLRASGSGDNGAPDADDVDVSVEGRAAANDMTFVRRAAIAGVGIALLPELVGSQAVESGSLRPVLPRLSVRGLPLYLVYPSSPHVPLKVRVLRDFLLRHFPQ